MLFSNMPTGFKNVNVQGVVSRSQFFSIIFVYCDPDFSCDSLGFRMRNMCTNYQKNIWHGSKFMHLKRNEQSR